MNVVLFDIQGCTANGIRCLSAKLKENKHSVKLIFEDSKTYRMIWRRNYIYQYKPAVVDQIIACCQGAHIIGFSVMTNYLDRVKQLTRELKKILSVPIVWGGIHPTICPQECLEYADMVCVGEGDKVFTDLINKMESGSDYYTTPGFVFKKDGEIIRNISNLELLVPEEIPAHDYGPQNHYVIQDGNIINITYENLPDFTGYQLTYDTARGCPYRCSYCCNDVYLRLYPHKRFLRLRNLSVVLDELAEILIKFPIYKSVFFTDDDFLFRKEEELRKFTYEYKKRIHLPFGITATPATCSDEKLSLLFDAGLCRINFGFQTANKNVQQQYNRFIPVEKLKEAAESIAKFEKIYNVGAVNIDVILESPFESDYERLNTVNFLLSLPMRFTLAFFSFTFYPGTSLTERAINEGMIKDDKEFIYRKTIQGPNLSIINSLFFLTQLAGQNKIPRWVVRLFTVKPIFALINRKIFNLILFHLGQFRYKMKYNRMQAANYI